MITVPGKILFYGGFSVLEKGNPSLSIAVCDENGKGVTAEYEEGERKIISPQFGLYLEPKLEDSQIVSFAYIFTEKYLSACAKLKRHTKITLSNSQIFGEKDHKTGLGSSAAATVAVVKALFESNGFDSDAHVETIHKISQLAYAAYSKKIGSGFDIATSSFGKTIMYRRYDPAELRLPATFEAEEIEKSLKESVNEPWEWIRTVPFAFPKQYSLIFFNIKRGSTSTISSVKAVMEWKKSNAEEYKKIIKMQVKAEEKAIAYLARHRSSGIRKYTHKAREAHQLLQDKVKTAVKDFDPIEPEQLKNIIEEAEKIEGVVAGRCPGAGGYDGLAFIVKRKFEGIGKILEIGDSQSLKLDHIKLKVL